MKALISVFDKTNLISFAKSLVELGVSIISTGGTYKHLYDANIPVTKIEAYTNYQEILSGRVKTLHPKIHAGILAVRDRADHIKDLENNNIDYIDIVCVNLYPFEETIKSANCSLEEAIENIDIGGPTLLRAAAKNYRYVNAIIDYRDYDLVVDELRHKGRTSLNTRFALASKVFRYTASYDAHIAKYLSNLENNHFPEKLTMTFTLHEKLRYGENPHQQAAYYLKDANLFYQQLQGKQLSYNNLQDINAAMGIISEFSELAVVNLKHLNPCAVALGNNVKLAFMKAYEGDPVSIFGGIVATNHVIDESTALELTKIFLEIVIAPGFTEKALEILKQKPNLRLLTVNSEIYSQIKNQANFISGGLLVQEGDNDLYDKLVYPTKRKVTETELKQLLFAYKVVKHVKSNAIVVAKEDMTLGIGAGQMNRVGAAKIALEQAESKAKDAVLASDGFFPMKDTVEAAYNAGIVAIIQPGGSIRDEESIKFCDDHNIAMVFTNMRHFKH